MELTKDQKRAAAATGSAAVSAGAGTGKTRMLAQRYLHHIRAHEFSPLSIVAITFTEKAADELRSRIRKTLSAELKDEKIIAEVEAAQISTIHSLAARICRDFYDLAGIPPDFSVLDETESPLWTSEKFDEAMGKIDPAIIEALGFNWLANSLPELLRDPYSSEKALAPGAKNFRAVIENERAAAIAKLISSEAWRQAETKLPSMSGAAGDLLEEARASAISSMDAIRRSENIGAAFEVLSRLKAHQGKAASWSPGGKEFIGGCLKSLKYEVTELLPLLSLEFSSEDEEIARRIEPLASAFQQVRDFMYAEKLREKVLDFNDLEHYALQILEREEAVEYYKKRWRAFLVDEFQDTNPIQAEIIRRLTREALLTIVGDEKQAIYGFRGANLRVFAQERIEILEKRGGTEVLLSKSFRTHEELVLKMNGIFEPVLGDLHQALEAHHKLSKKTKLNSGPFFHLAGVEKEGGSKAQNQIIEARYIAEQIAQLHLESEIAYKEIAILAPRWAPLDIYVDVLSAFGIPAINVGGGNLLETREALDLFALLSFLAEPNDDIPLVAILRSPFFALSDRVLYEASKKFGKELSWWQAIKGIPGFSRAVGILQTLLDARHTKSPRELFAFADRLTGYSAVIENLPHGARRAADLRGLNELLLKLESRGRGDVFGAVRYLRELLLTETEVPRPPLDTGEAVSLMTIHKAKGLEWPVVFVSDLSSKPRGNTPPILVDTEIGVAFKIDGAGFDKTEPAIYKLIARRKSTRETDEARRLFYVAITRAEDKVILTAAAPKGFGLDILRPGLEAAGIPEEVIRFDANLAIAPAPQAPKEFAKPEKINVAPVAIGLREIPVTALSAYAVCPKRFEFQFVKGHPGLSEGFAHAMAIGSLTHKALELDIRDIETLRRETDVAFGEADLQDSQLSSDAELQEALKLAEIFRTSEKFAQIRSAANRKEVEFVKEIGGLRLTGIADLVGDDFVLDYKTDSEMNPEEHQFQLWAYARLLEKPRAFIAYLRKNELHEFTESKLAEIEKEGMALIERIRTADYTAAPSEHACGNCAFREICKFRYASSTART